MHHGYDLFDAWKLAEPAREVAERQHRVGHARIRLWP